MPERTRRPKNRLHIEGDMLSIGIADRFEAKTDAQALPLVSVHTWHIAVIKGVPYVRNSKGVYLHRVIMDAPKDKQVDHINHDTLDNRRANLRIASNAENNQNRNGAYKSSSTGVRGVTVQRDKAGRTYYKARVMVNYRTASRRYFPLTEEGLAHAAVWVAGERHRLMPHSGDAPDPVALASLAPATRRVRHDPTIVAEAKRRIAAGEGTKAIGQALDIDLSTISAIRHGRRHRDTPLS